MEIPSAYQFKEVEEKIYKLWEKSGFFNPDKLPGKRKHTFTVVIPPPNVTGTLHMGHALNNTIQDIVIRQKRMLGFKTLWLPGTDHAGIATQNVVEKELKKEGLNRFDLGKEKFIERVWQWVKKYGNIILDQFKKMGCSLDWSRTKFTLDKEYSLAVQQAFLHYYQKGLIYPGKRPVNWCSRCQTSLSDLEVEYREEKGTLWYIKYPLKTQKPENKDQKFIVVATTRPETMLGDMAVAVNPKDERYKEMIGQKVVLPLANREIPIIADKLVDPKFGTGAVKVTPGHSLIDYEISLKHNLEILQVIDETGIITANTPLPYQNLNIYQARAKIIEDLNNLGLLEKTEEITHQIPKCYRCQTVLEVLPSNQWFLKMSGLAKIAMEAVKRGKTKFHPKNFEKIYFDWLKNIKDWCISRQIWWGHQLPVWYCQNNIEKDKILTHQNFIVSLKKPKKCPFCQKCSMKQSDDVLDTWFSSALWPFATLGWPKKTRDLKTFYPTNFLTTGRDIINFWVTRMIFSGLEFMKKIPFKDVYVHGTVLTKEGKRMSKSLGTGIDPLLLVDKYGADAVRFGLTWQLTGNQDIRFVEDNIVMAKKFCNKIWNASRFVLIQFSIFNFQFSKNFQFPISKLTVADKRILKVLDKTIKSVNKDLENFRFGAAAHQLYHFFWHNFCDQYIEQAKIQLAKNLTNKKTTTFNVLFYVLLNSLKLLHPFMPFITEEIYQKLPIKDKKRCLMIEQWPI